MLTRRHAIHLLTGSALGAVGAARAQNAPPALSETDPQAQSLGYVSDAKRADKARFPKYAAGQHCAACQLYQGAATLPMAPCALFAGKQVAGPGWCSAFVARPA